VARATTTVVQGDCLDEASVNRALAGVDTAYYLVHSMAAGAHFEGLDQRAALNFGLAAARAGVRRIIYLGGLGEDAASLSRHLKSRAETGNTLRAAGVPVVEFRASIVIGAGSLPFEMIRALVERLPVMICPRWVDTPTEPIAVDDVIAYLVAALDLREDGHSVFEIGGPEVVSYGDLMRCYARLRGLRRVLLPVPVITPHLSGLWLGLVTPAQARIGRALVEGLRNATVVRSDTARRTFGITPVPLHEAVARAVSEDRTYFKTDRRTVIVDVPPVEAFAPIRRIGGDAGWYFGKGLWRLRAWFDRCIGGVGMTGGRRDSDLCEVGDTIDGWTVEAFEPDRRLRLVAGMKLPGQGWLEFEVTPIDSGRRSLISQTATFDPRGVLGRAYWGAVLPLHAFMFRGMLQGLARRAAGGKRTRLATAALLLCAVALVPETSHSQPNGPVRTVQSVDLDRYAGDWFEIGRFPNRFQRRCVGDVTASYARRSDGKLDVINRCRTGGESIAARGVARVADDTGARLKVRFAPAALSFLPFVWGDYWILGLAGDYSWAVIGSPDREYLWVLARTPTLGADAFELAIAVARANGFDVDRLERTAPRESSQELTFLPIPFRERRDASDSPRPAFAIITSVDLTIASASSPRRSLRARTASAVMTAVSD